MRGTNGVLRENKSPYDSLADQLFEESTDADIDRNKPSIALTLPSLTDESMNKTQFLKRGCHKILGMAHKRRQFELTQRSQQVKVYRSTFQSTERPSKGSVWGTDYQQLSKESEDFL